MNKLVYVWSAPLAALAGGWLIAFRGDFVAGIVAAVIVLVYGVLSAAFVSNQDTRTGPFVLWFTGLSGSGKSTIADRVYESLAGKGMRVEKVDGDSVRDVFPQTGFTRDERNSHIRRMGYLVSMLEKNGVSVVASFISPYIESRDFVRSRCSRFVEIFVDASLEECERRDVKGLYGRARAGQIPNFTGIDDPYEAPQRPELVLHTATESVEESCKRVLDYINKNLAG